MAWTYRVTSHSQNTTYVVTDEVVGSKYIPALELTGSVVQEFYDLDRGGLRPIVYYERRGYLTRLSGLDYEMREINSPTWGRSEELNFLPDRLEPIRRGTIPYSPTGDCPAALISPKVTILSLMPMRSTVPAGRYAGCIRVETAARYHGGIYDQQKQALGLTYVDWYAPGVGLVLTVAHEGGASGDGDRTGRADAFHAGCPHRHGAGASTVRCSAWLTANR